MGYDTYYSGELKISPQLSAYDQAVLYKLLPSYIDAPPQNSHLQLRLEQEQPAIEALRAVLDRELDYAPFQLTPQKLTIYDEYRGGSPDEWLEIMIQHFFQPRGYQLEGEISWKGEDSDDLGLIYVHGHQVEVQRDEIFNPGPRWDPCYYASPALTEWLRRHLAIAQLEALQQLGLSHLAKP